jgi:single-stranded DNA-binding protein
MQTRSWADQTTGEKKYRTELIANQMLLLGGRGENGAAAPKPAEDAAPDDWGGIGSNGDVPF